jgi:hypothetical protein
MAENNYCLKNIIGLTNKDCDCFGEVLEDYSVSSTGLYLDTHISPHIELEYGCDALNTWEKLNEKLVESKNLFISELSSRLNRKYSKKHSNLNEILGRKNHVTIDYTITEPKFIIKTKQYKGFCIRINSLGLLVNTSGTVDVVVKKTTLKNVTTTLRTVTVYVVNGIANVLEIVNQNEEPFPIILDCDGSTYTLEYELDSFNVYNNTIENSCSTCNTDLHKLIPYLSETLSVSNNKIANGFLIGIDGLCDISKLPCLILNNAPELLHTFGDLIAKRTKMQILSNAISSGTSYRLVANNDIGEELEKTTKQYYSGIETLLKSNLPLVQGSCFSKESDAILTVS